MAAQRDLLLIFVAFHPSLSEVSTLNKCLHRLPSNIGYGVVVNDYIPGEPISKLEYNADYFIPFRSNLGYGRAVNALVQSLNNIPRYIAVLNTDLYWNQGTFTTLLDWMCIHPEVCLAVPQVLDLNGVPQHLCKQNPTFLALLSRRLIPENFKPKWLKRYDRWYTMSDNDYMQIFDSTYLSGCCMLIRSNSFLEVKGFDERYFLYLEDADLTRTLSHHGRCIHLPIASVFHSWGRGNYRSFRLLIVNIMSAYHYFTKWGFLIW